MAVSDVLWRAVEYIQEDLEEFPDSHRGLERQLRVVVTVMDAMRVILDSPPPDDLNHRCRGLYEAYVRAIAEIDVTRLENVERILEEHWRAKREEWSDPGGAKIDSWTIKELGLRSRRERGGLANE
jgi:hypothetical protein